jgi:hypothetical protein
MQSTCSSITFFTYRSKEDSLRSEALNAGQGQAHTQPYTLITSRPAPLILRRVIDNSAGSLYRL